MAIETQQISASNVIETDTRVFAHPDDISKLDLLNITQPTDIDYILNKVNSITNPIQDRGAFDPTIDQKFPSGAQSGWLYRITKTGTIGAMTLDIGDTIFAIADIVDRTDSSLWVKIDNTENTNILRNNIILTDPSLVGSTNTNIASALAVKTYVDSELMDLNSTLMAAIDEARQIGGSYSTNVSEWLNINLDMIPTNSHMELSDMAESIIRIYIEGWGDIIDGWTHSQGDNVILFENDIEHIGKRCKITYLVKG